MIEKTVAQSVTEQTKEERRLQDQKLFKEQVEPNIDDVIMCAARLGKDTAYYRLSDCLYPTATSISNLRNIVVEAYRHAGYIVTSHCCKGFVELTISW